MYSGLLKISIFLNAIVRFFFKFYRRKKYALLPTEGLEPYYITIIPFFVAKTSISAKALINK